MDSVADMYRDILPASPSGGLTSHKVKTLKIDSEGNPILVQPGGATYFPKGPNYGYNALTGDYEVQQPGNAYAAGGGRPNYDFAPAAQAIEAAAAPSLASMFGSSFNGGWGSDGFVLPSMNQYEANGLPVDSDRPLNMRSGAPSVPAPMAAPVAPPKTLLQSLADMFTPAKTSAPARPRTVAQPGFNGSKVLRSGDLSDGRGSIFGENAVLPPSMNNERWNTGY